MLAVDELVLIVPAAVVVAILSLVGYYVKKSQASRTRTGSK